MVDVLRLLWAALNSIFRSMVRLEAEILVLRQQINVLRRKDPKRFAFGTFGRLVFVELYRLVPGIADALAIVRPERAWPTPSGAHPASKKLGSGAMSWPGQASEHDSDHGQTNKGG